MKHASDPIWLETEHKADCNGLNWEDCPACLELFEAAQSSYVAKLCDACETEEEANAIIDFYAG